MLGSVPQHSQLTPFSHESSAARPFVKVEPSYDNAAVAHAGWQGAAEQSEPAVQVHAAVKREERAATPTLVRHEAQVAPRVEGVERDAKRTKQRLPDLRRSSHKRRTQTYVGSSTSQPKRAGRRSPVDEDDKPSRQRKRARSESRKDFSPLLLARMELEGEGFVDEHGYGTWTSTLDPQV
jgi:hypothetical protein